jgi:hypothetical protein
MRTKTNPRRRPATQADVERARDEAVRETVRFCMVVFFTVLLDKFAASKDDLQRVWDEVNDLSDSVKKKYVSLKDLKTVLVEEYDIHLD